MAEITAREMQRLGCIKRWGTKTPEERKDFARKLANARWSRATEEQRKEFGKRMAEARRRKKDGGE